MDGRTAHGSRMRRGAACSLFVVKQNRRNSTLQLIKRAMEKGRFGRIHLVTINVFWSRPQSYYDSAKWRGTWEFDGGALMNQASHYVDLRRLADRTGRERAGLRRDARAQHSGGGHGDSRGSLALRCARLDQRHHADVSERTSRVRSPSSARTAPYASAVSQ